MPAPPRPFGSYELLQRFAISGTAELWLARPRQRRGDEPLVILKRILPHLADQPEAVELFLQEAKRGAPLQHPNIARIHEFGEVHGLAYIASEYVDGEPLDAVMHKVRATGPQIPVDVSLYLMARVCEALAYAYHRVDHLDRPQRLLHGEIACRHILLGSDGAVKVMGFGAGNPANLPEPVRAGFSQRRVENLAPEQLMGREQDQRTDLFGAGLVLYELLTESSPFRRGSALESIQAVYDCQIVPPSRVAHIPPEVDALVMKALAKEKEDRYADPRDFQSALEAYLSARDAKVGPARIEELMRTLFPNRQSAT